MNVTLRVPRMTRDQFLDWAARQEAPYEFDGYEPIAMTGGNNRHSRLCRNLTVALHARLEQSPFEVMPEAGVATVGHAVRYPDVLITPAFGADLERLVSTPVVVFEVLSPTSGRIDHAVKLREYRAVDSILRYVIVHSTGTDLTVHTRASGGTDWTSTSLTAGELLPLPEVGIDLPVDDIFRNIVFDETNA